MKITKLRKMVFAFCISIVLFSINFLNVFAEKNLSADTNSSITVSETQLIEENIAEYDEHLEKDIDDLMYQCKIEKGVADTYIYDIPNPEMKAGSTTGSINVDSIDSSGSTKGWCTIYYTITTNADGIQFRKMTKVSGGYTILDNAFSVISQKVEAVQTGVDLSGVGGQENFGPVYPTKNPWSYSTGFSHSISLNFSHYMSAKYQLTIKRQSTWTFDIVNML